MGLWAVVEEGVVTNTVLWDGVVYDPETGIGWPPPEGSTMVELSEGSSVGIGWSYTDGVFSAPPPPEVPPPTPEEILANNQTTQNQLIYQASVLMAPVMVSLQLGDADDDETTKAKAWQAYYRALKLVDLTVAEPDWPIKPSDI